MVLSISPGSNRVLQSRGHFACQLHASTYNQAQLVDKEQLTGAFERTLRVFAARTAPGCLKSIIPLIFFKQILPRRFRRGTLLEGIIEQYDAILCARTQDGGMVGWPYPKTSTRITT